MANSWARPICELINLLDAGAAALEGQELLAASMAAGKFATRAEVLDGVGERRAICCQLKRARKTNQDSCLVVTVGG